MARNANKVATQSSGNKVPQKALSGSFPARIVQVVFLGVQEQRAYQGVAKPPVDQIRITYELSHEFMMDENGEPVADKPRWESEQIAFHSASVDLATSTKRFKTYRPDAPVTDYNWDDSLLGTAVQVTLASRDVTQGKHAGKTFTDIKGVTPAAQMPGYVQPELVNPAVFFDPQDENVSVEAFNGLPDFMQDIIKGSLDYADSDLCATLAGGGAPVAPKAPAPAPVAAPAPVPVATEASAGVDDPF